MRVFEQALFDREEIDKDNELERLDIDSFEALSSSDLRRYNAALMEHEDYTVLASGITATQLDTEPSYSFGGFMERSFQWELEKITDHLNPAVGAGYPGLVIESHQETLSLIEKYEQIALSMDSGYTQDIRTQAVAMSGLFNVRKDVGAQRTIARLNTIIRSSPDEFVPWVIAEAEPGKHKPAIAARLVGFTTTSYLRDLPVVEPVVLNFFGKQKGLLPEGYRLREDWLKYAVIDEDDENES